MPINDSNKVDQFDNEQTQLVHNDVAYQGATEATIVVQNTILSNGTQKTKISNGSIDAEVRQSTPNTSTSGLVVRTIPYRPNTFSVLSPNTATANGKTMIGIYNTGSSVIKIEKVFLINDRTTAAVGVACTFSLQRITSLTAGTNLTPVPHDTNYTLPSGISCSTNSTQAGAASIFRSATWSTDEWAPGGLDQEGLDHSIQYSSPFYQCDENEDNITVRQNQAVLIRCDTNTTTGVFDLRIIFTVE